MSSTSLFTAAREAQQAQLQADEDAGFIPAASSYLVAADTHNVANGNQTFFESAAETISNIPKFIGASIVSGVNQVYNIAPSIGNMLGGDFELSDTSDVMQAIDSDLGKYYEDHQESVDAGGFILSSFVPGLAGIKGLRAVQSAGAAKLGAAMKSGKVGDNMGWAMGLLQPSRQKHLDAAISAVTNTNSPFKLMERNLLKSLGAGFGQNILEAAAFETAVAATLFESPVLKEQDVSDLVYNIAFGGVVFGAVGGVIDATRGAFQVRKAIKGAAAEEAPWKHIEIPLPQTTASDKIILFGNQTEMPAIPAEIADEGRRAFIERTAKKKLEALNNGIREAMGELAGGDQRVASSVFHDVKGQNGNTMLTNFLDAKSISRISDTTEVERTLKKVAKAEKKATGSKADLSTLEADLAALPDVESLSVAFVRHWGEDVGEMVTNRPVVTMVTDTLKKGQRLKFSNEGVKIVGEKLGTRPGAEYKFDAHTPWSTLSSTAVEANARHLWAQKLPSLDTLAKKSKKPIVIHADDVPMVEKAFREFDPARPIIARDGTRMLFSDQAEMLNFIQGQKEFLAVELGELTVKGGTKVDKKAMAEKLARFTDDNVDDIPAEMMGAYKERAAMLNQEEIASILNVKNSYLSGMESKDIASDIFALQSYAEEYTARMVKQGIIKESEGILDLTSIPQHTKFTYEKKALEGIDGNVLEGMAMIKQRQVLHVEELHRAAAIALGDDFERLVFPSDKQIIEADKLGSGAGSVGAASNNYGSLAAVSEYNGQAVTGMIERRVAAVKELLEPALIKLARNQEAAIEWSSTVAKLRSFPDQYVLNETGDALIPKVVKTAQEAQARGLNPKEIVLRDPNSPMEIPLVNKEVQELVALHIEANGVRVEGMRGLRTAQGYQYNNASDVFYPPPPNIKDFPFFATVTDESLTGAGHTKMIYANSEAQLEAMIAKLSDEPGFTVRTAKDAENYWKSVGQFEFEKTLNENYMNSALVRRGVSSPAIIPTDPTKIVNELLSWHTGAEAGLVRESVSTAMEKQFSELRRLGDAFTGVATSKFGSLSTLKHADEVVENPYMDYVRTSLGLRNYTDYPFWTSANRLLDSKVTKLYQTISNTMHKAKSPEDLDAINTQLRKYGYKGAAYDEQMELLANHTAPRGALSEFIRRSNSILASVVLRLDHLNAVNNAVGANVLLGAETRAVLRAIGRGDENALGELSKLMNIKVPGTDQLMMSPAKLIANAIRAFGSKDKTLMQFFRDNRFITTITDQYNSTLDDLVLQGGESVSMLEGKIKSAMDKAKKFGDFGEKVTGNRLAEEFNRFVAAHVMKQISDVGVKHGLISAKEQLAYINTFVNRTQGNYLAAQRPMMFQGPVGQAIGLFQTYQFNLMQQLLRHVGEGTAKDSMTLLGLQGTIYGMNGLPAFNAINTHLVGNASGNDKHRDLYDTLYGAAGKDAGDWLMYGVASNLILHPDLKVNLYVRGDINPRHPTIVPTNPAEVPIVQAFGKVMTNIVNTTKTMANGGDVLQTFLQGLEHNGISRPLAGLAQTMEGLTNPAGQSYSTSKRGNVIASNDFLSLANLGRLVGGKPLDEAIAIDAAFRFKAYGLIDKDRRRQLGKAIKTTLIAGGEPTAEQLEGFSSEYAAMGGKQNEFNKWMVQLYKTANTSQANEIQRNLNDPFNKSMQTIMGGFELKDFTNTDD